MSAPAAASSSVSSARAMPTAAMPPALAASTPAGVRDYNGELSIDPRLPAEWTSLSYSLRVRDRQLRVELAHEEERYLLEDGDPVELTIRGTSRRLEAGSPLIVRPVADAPAEPVGT